MKVIKLNATNSTNSYLMELNGQNNLQDETVVWALSQTAGRGQHASHWQSKAGDSLTFSVFKRFKSLAVERQFSLNYAVAVAVANVLNDLKLPAVKIKWPNDIMSAGRKISGILIENQLKGRFIRSGVIGVGINVNEEQFEDLPKAGSVYLQTGIKFDLEEVLAAVLNEIRKQLQYVEKGADDQVKAAFESSLYRRDVVSVFQTPDKDRFNGIIRGVSDSGQLVVETETDGRRSFMVKEIELIS